VIRPPDSLTTGRLLLRRPRSTDAAAVYEYGRDPAVTRYLVFPTHRSLADAERFLATCAPHWESGQEFCWLIALKVPDRVVGSIACRVRGHAADIGYALARAYWGAGYATEAGRAVVAWAAGLEGYRIWAVCDIENLASARVLETLGMAREGILRRWSIHPNVSTVPRDCYVYARVRDQAA
jgi:ribosomal-protein-alanine N-acetyltransferase